jgi:hypothetical protein
MVVVDAPLWDMFSHSGREASKVAHSRNATLAHASNLCTYVSNSCKRQSKNNLSKQGRQVTVLCPMDLFVCSQMI